MSGSKKKPSGPAGVNWNDVDLAATPTAELVKLLGVTKQAVHAARKARGIASPEKQGGYRGPVQSAARLALTTEAVKHLRALALMAGKSPTDYVLSLR